MARLQSQGSYCWQPLSTRSLAWLGSPGHAATTLAPSVHGVPDTSGQWRISDTTHEDDDRCRACAFAMARGAEHVDEPCRPWDAHERGHIQHRRTILARFLIFRISWRQKPSDYGLVSSRSRARGGRRRREERQSQHGTRARRRGVATARGALGFTMSNHNLNISPHPTCAM